MRKRGSGSFFFSNNSSSLRGRKRLFIYPGDERHLPERNMEQVVARQTTEELPYALAFENDAQVMDLEPGRALTWPLIEPHRDQIKTWLDADVTIATIAQRLRDEHAVAVSESSVRRWIATHFAEEVARAKVTVPRGPVEPGSEAQIDYGRLGMWFDPAVGRRVAVWAFVMVQSCSRLMFVHPVLRLDQTSWCASHVLAFAYFGGCVARRVPDNLKTTRDPPFSSTRIPCLSLTEPSTGSV